MKTYYVCFRFYDKDHGLTITAPSFRTWLFGHCFMIIETAEDRCMMIDKTNRSLKFIHFPCTAAELALKLKADGTIIHDVPICKNAKWQPEFFSCTGIIKDALGIKKWWIITPYQLWREVNEYPRI